MPTPPTSAPRVRQVIAVQVPASPARRNPGGAESMLEDDVGDAIFDEELPGGQLPSYFLPEFSLGHGHVGEFIVASW